MIASKGHEKGLNGFPEEGWAGPPDVVCRASVTTFSPTGVGLGGRKLCYFCRCEILLMVIIKYGILI